MMKPGTVIPYLKKIQKTYESREIPFEFCWHQYFSPEISKFCYIKKYRIVLTNMVPILMISTKMATVSLLKIEIFWNKVYDVIVSAHDVTNKIISCDSDYIVDMVMWPKFGNSSISIRQVIITLILKRLDKEKHFFEGWSWSKFNNLGLTLGMALTFYTSVAKGQN